MASCHLSTNLWLQRGQRPLWHMAWLENVRGSGKSRLTCLHVWERKEGLMTSSGHGRSSSWRHPNSTSGGPSRAGCNVESEIISMNFHFCLIGNHLSVLRLDQSLCTLVPVASHTGHLEDNGSPSNGGDSPVSKCHFCERHHQSQQKSL